MDLNKLDENLKEQLKLIEKVQNEKCYKSYKKLLNEYNPLIKSLSHSFKNKYHQTPLELEDIKNVMSFNFYKLIIDYDLSKNKTFPNYIKEFLYFRTSSWIKHYITKNHQVMNYYDYDKVESIGINLLEIESTNEILNTKNTSSLSDVEIKVIDLLKNNYSIKQISEELNINIKTVYVIKNKAVKKIKNNFKINN